MFRNIKFYITKLLKRTWPQNKKSMENKIPRPISISLGAAFLISAAALGYIAILLISSDITVSQKEMTAVT